MIFTIFALLVIYQLKHFLADYPLQTDYMIGKFKPDWGFLLPLLSHCYVHALGTYLIALMITSNLGFSTLLSLLDGTIHFVMDRLKAGPKYMGRWKALSGKEWMTAKMLSAGEEVPESEMIFGYTDVKYNMKRADSLKKLHDNKLFWISIGIDQACHHLTHYLCIYLILRHIGII